MNIQKYNTVDVIQEFRNYISGSVEFSVQNIFYFNSGKIESDILAVSKSLYLTEYEVKISRADFLVDKKKAKWRFYSMNYNKAPKHFYCIAPVGVIDISEIPSYSGLIEFEKINDSYEFKTVQKPKSLNKMKVTEKQVYLILKKLYYKTITVKFDHKNLKKPQQNRF